MALLLRQGRHELVAFSRISTYSLQCKKGRAEDSGIPLDTPGTYLLALTLFVKLFSAEFIVFDTIWSSRVILACHCAGARVLLHVHPQVGQEAAEQLSRMPG